MQDVIEVQSNGEVFVQSGMNTRMPYEHQKNALACLDKMDVLDSYRTLVVLPTGGGKTYTASLWLLKNAIDQHKKVLWIAHRQMLLEQAAQSFQRFSYHTSMPHRTSYRYRIISGASKHDRTIDIEESDDVIFASKDSIRKNLDCLASWLREENELYLIIDEAHHSTAKTYRCIIEHLGKRIPKLKVIGLTATPFRTAEDEQGLLARIYTDGIHQGEIKRGDIGISYQIGLKELINRQILSKPIFESCYTDTSYGENLGLDRLHSIQHLDILPEDIMKKMIQNAPRNQLIVNTYKKKQKQYGQMILFALNITHAIELASLFNQAGIPCAYIVSGVRDSITGVTISDADNEQKLEDFRQGRLQVLTNVNILTEGVDLPQTKTVFLTRPTVSTSLMTQMIGRALRGKAAGGTDEAYIVSFIDDWNEHIAWVNPESLFCGNNEFKETQEERVESTLRMIAISKVEEFARMLDSSIDTMQLERVPFVKRIPIGMYAFTYLEENDGIDHSYQVMVYDSTRDAYEHMMQELPELFREHCIDNEYLNKEQLQELEQICRDSYFCGEMIPPYEKKDCMSILRYYAQYESVPPFYTFDEIDRSKLDVAKIAQYIREQDMGDRQSAIYINALWENSDQNLLRIFFGKKLYFVKQIDIEREKLSHPDLYEEERRITYGKKSLEDLSLYEIGRIDPAMEKRLRDAAFAASLNEAREYVCACCGRHGYSRAIFQVDHIIPMNKGGKSIPENLQILCRSCNAIKGDKL